METVLRRPRLVSHARFLSVRNTGVKQKGSHDKFYFDNGALTAASALIKPKPSRPWLKYEILRAWRVARMRLWRRSGSWSYRRSLRRGRSGRRLSVRTWCWSRCWRWRWSRCVGDGVAVGIGVGVGVGEGAALTVITCLARFVLTCPAVSPTVNRAG